MAKIRWHQTHRMYPQLPMQCESILPDNGMPTKVLSVGIVTGSENHDFYLPVYVTRKPPEGERWGHRVYVICWCGKHIPFGRMNQHVKAINHPEFT